MKTATEILRELGVSFRGNPKRSFKTTCPRCSHTRKHKDDPCLSVRVDDTGVGVRCFNCNYTDGRFYDFKPKASGMVGSAPHQRGGGDRYGALLRQARTHWR